MRISLFIARTYLLSFKNKTFISFINVLSFLGLVIGVASLICVTSIFDGFRILVRDMLLTIDPHVRISLTNEHNPKLKEHLHTYSEVVSTKYSASSKVIAGFHEKTQGAILFAHDGYASESKGNTTAIGIGLADKLGIKKGDTIHVSTPQMIDLAISGMMIPTYRELIIDSIFQISSGVQYDNSYLICNTTFIQENDIRADNFLDITISNPENVDEFIHSLKTDPQCKQMSIDSWKDLHRELYSTMEFERNISFIILGLISCVSVFNLLIAMWMTVKSKRKDIAILLSMGADTTNIRQAFLLQGLIVGIAGTGIGGIFGILLCIGQQHYGWIQLPNSIVEAMPIHLQWEVVVISISLGVLLSALAGIYPAILAASTNIAEEIRHE